MGIDAHTVQTRNSKSFVPLQNPANLSVDVIATKDVSRVSYRSPTETIYKCYNDRDSVAPSVMSDGGRSGVSPVEAVPPVPHHHLLTGSLV